MKKQKIQILGQRHLKSVCKRPTFITGSLVFPSDLNKDGEMQAAGPNMRVVLCVVGVAVHSKVAPGELPV